jgi:hypothetical protein
VITGGTKPILASLRLKYFLDTVRENTGLEEIKTVIDFDRPALKVNIAIPFCYFEIPA